MTSRCLGRLLLALLLLAALFLVPGVVLMGGEWLPELLGAVEDYAPSWTGLLKFLIFSALCWVWLWEGGTPFQIALALLLWFCTGWALCLLLRPRRAKMTP